MEIDNSPELGKERTTIGKILEAIETKDKRAMISALNETNQRLTGQLKAHFADEEILSTVVEKILEAIEKGDDEIVYLGDGGYSRLHVGIYLDEPSVVISNSSRDEVKTEWKKLQMEYEQAK